MTAMARNSFESTKAVYDKMLQRTRETARNVEERVQHVARRFPCASASQDVTDRRMLVLIVEDDKDHAESLAVVLRLWGFQAEIAHDGDTGLDTAIRNRPDAILADIELPGLNGFEFARLLNALPDFRNTLLAAVTAYNDPASLEESKEVGFVKHFSKPVDLAALHRLLDDRRDLLLRNS